MKRLLLIIFIFFTLCLPSYAADSLNLTFVYINGSNNNDEKMKNWYLNGVERLHPLMKKRFEKNSYIKKLSKNYPLNITKEPKAFFWGYNSKSDLEFVKERLDITKSFSSIIAFEVRSLITQFLHDAIWIQKDHNMLEVIDELNNVVKDLAAQNQNVVLFGYSAGSFVTYQYMMYKLPYIDFENLFTALDANEEIIQFVRENPRKKTCLHALMHNKGNLGVMSSSGQFVLNQNTEMFKTNYLNIDSATDNYCAPVDRVSAVVNFASPIPLFFSDLGDENYELSFYNKYMLKYIMENGIYFLTVNFREDPLGFPSSRNLTIPQMEQILDVKFENPTGVIYDNSKVWSKRSAITAHTSYWSGRGVFSKAVAKSFVNSYKFLYDTKYQQKVLKRRKDPEALYPDKRL